jgi:hypothetical protein
VAFPHRPRSCDAQERPLRIGKWVQ